MKCNRAEYLIAVLVSGEIEEEDKTVLLEHIKFCQGCREAYEKHRVIENELRGLTGPVPNAGFAKGVAGLVQDLAPPKPSWGFREILSLVTPFPALSIIFALAVTVLWVIFNGALVDWVRNITLSVVYGISTPIGMVYTLSFASIVIVIIAWRIHRTARDF